MCSGKHDNYCLEWWSGFSDQHALQADDPWLDGLWTAWKSLHGGFLDIVSWLYLGTSVGLRTYNSYLNVQKQDYERQIAALQKDNEVAQMEVNQLSTYDRIMEIAAKDGMQTYNGNVITVTANE